MIREVFMSPRSSRIRNIFEPLNRSLVTKVWQERFGISEQAFSGYRFFKKAQSIWAISDVDLPALSYEAIGMRIMNCKDRPWKPTTSALQIFGRYATKNIIHLNGEEATIFLEGGSQVFESECEIGYVVVFYRGDVLGCGLYSHGKLVSQIPKERRMASTDLIEACPA
jgi:NOL1/NOP2/fmu family ribosome biogenesis protein